MRPIDAPSFEEVFAEHARYVWRGLRYLGVQERDIEDVCQEVFLVVHRRLSTFEGRSSVRTWVYGIAVRVAADYRRRRRTSREQLGGEPVEPSAPCEIDRAEARRLLQRALDALDDDRRAVLILHELEGFSIPEVAEILGCPVQTAYSRLQVAREQVARILRRAGRRRA